MKHKYILATLFTGILSLAAQAGDLVIDGHLAVLDSVTGTYLCPTTIVNFGQDLETDVWCEGATLSINGTPVPDGGYYTFDAIAGGKNWTVELTQGDSTVTRQLTFTYLPLVLLNGNFGKEYTQGTVQVLDPDEYIDDMMLSMVKWRGATTNIGDKHKRNYHLKFINSRGEKKNQTFFGLRNDNSWILDAGQVDFLRVRNRVNTELWNDFASKPYYYDREPKAKTGVDGQMVELFLNGQYMGIYALTEGMDRKELKIKEYNPETGEIHGQLWKAEGLTNTTSFNSFKPYNNQQETWQEFETKYPELDEVCPTDYKALGDGVYLGDTTSVAEFNATAHERFDMPVMIDYEIFLQTMLGVDNYAKNIYWLTYDTQESPMLTLAVWDLDTSMGGWWNTSSYHPSEMSPTRSFKAPNGIFVRMCRPTYIYYRQSIERYQELRKGPLSTDSLIARYTAAVNFINDCGAVQREQQRWSRDSDLSGRVLDINAELAYVTDWITKRMDFLDKTRFAMPAPGDVNVDQNIDIVDVNAVVNAMLSEGYLGNANADVNGDKTVDITDINQIFNILLNP